MILNFMCNVLCIIYYVETNKGFIIYLNYKKRNVMKILLILFHGIPGTISTIHILVIANV